MTEQDREIRDRLVAIVGELNRWLKDAAMNDIICEIQGEELKAMGSRIPVIKVVVRMFKEL